MMAVCTAAAVAVAFAKFGGVLVEVINESNYLIFPVHISEGYAVSLSTAQLLGIVLIVVLTVMNKIGRAHV